MSILPFCAWNVWYWPNELGNTARYIDRWKQMCTGHLKAKLKRSKERILNSYRNLSTSCAKQRQQRDWESSHSTKTLRRAFPLIRFGIGQISQTPGKDSVPKHKEEDSKAVPSCIDCRCRRNAPRSIPYKQTKPTTQRSALHEFSAHQLSSVGQIALWLEVLEHKATVSTESWSFKWQHYP